MVGSGTFTWRNANDGLPLYPAEGSSAWACGSWLTRSHSWLVAEIHIPMPIPAALVSRLVSSGIHRHTYTDPRAEGEPDVYPKKPKKTRLVKSLPPHMYYPKHSGIYCQVLQYAAVPRGTASYTGSVLYLDSRGQSLGLLTPLVSK